MATPHQNRRRRRFGLILGTIVAALMLVAVAYADNTVPDGDGTAPISAEPMTFGNVSCGQATSANALIAINRNGAAGSTNVFKNGSTVTVSVLSVTGSGLSASMTTNTIALPADWGAKANNTLSASVTSQVTINSSIPGPGSGSIAYRATGVNSSDATINRDATMAVSWTTGSCDTIAPTAAPTQSPAANANGWNNTDVTVNWNWSDNAGGSGIDAANCTTSSTSSGEGTLTLNATCKDGAGNTGNASYTVKVDKTAPTVVAAASPAANASGWNNTNVTVSFSGTDVGGSGIASCSADVVLSTEGANQSASGSCTDLAGNVSATATKSGINIDKTDPTATASAAPAANANGWNNTDVTVSFSGTDVGGSGIASCSADVVLSTEGANQSASGSCTDLAGNVSATATKSGINIDKTAPTATASAAPAANANGWNNTDVTVSFNGSDGSGSGIDFCDADVVLSSEGTGLSASGSCTDKAGNVSAVVTKSGIKIDKTAPTNLTFVGGPAAGESYYFGSVPAAPACTADGAISGLSAAGCTVSGYSTAVGSHTMTASATDLAGNTGTANRSYTVLAWTLSGFFQPVDMGSTVFNTVKAGSTVPLKFRVFAGPTELTETSAVKTLSYVKITCGGAAIEDAIEELAPAGGTLLRYDSTGGQFIYNLKTSGKAGECYRATMTAQDNSKIEAQFKLK